MKKISVEAKTIEDATNLACEKLNASKDEIVVIEKEEKKGIFSKKIIVEAITKEEVNKEIKKIIHQIINGLNAEINIEISIKNDIPYYNLITNEAIMIGKNGRTLDAIQILINSILNKELNNKYRVIIDVNNYKQKRDSRLQKLAKYTAKEVAKSKIEVKLDRMNSYERRIIHEALANSKDVVTESTGEEPNRCVVIKPKED